MSGALGLPQALWDVLACPLDGAGVEPDEATGRIRCTQCGRGYEISDGIPVMLPPQEG